MTTTMTWPGLSDVTYRLWRLKRLIAFCLIPSIAALLLTMLFGVGVVSGFGGLVRVVLIVACLIAAHVVLFPNAYSETIALALVTGLGLLLAPLLGGSYFLWFLFGLFAIWGWMSGQGRVLVWSMATKPHHPVFKSSIATRASVEEARNWFPMRPGLARGPYRCGDAGPDGVFPVWYDTGTSDFMGAQDIEPDLCEEIEMPELPPSFYAVIDEVGEDFQKTRILESKRADAEVQAIVEHRFKAQKSGCIVTERETPTTFPWGQSLTLWLNDFAQDGLVQTRDLLEGRETLAVRAAHHGSLLQIVGAWFVQRMIKRGELPADYPNFADAEIDDARLTALLERLGPEFTSKGYSTGPLPLVTLEEFFEGNGDSGSFQAGDISASYSSLLALRARDDVADIRMGVTQWEGPGQWPLAEYIYVVTTGDADDFAGWMKDAGIWVSETGTEDAHRPSEALELPEGHRIVWAWID